MPWGVPPRFLGRLPGTPAIAFEAGAVDPRFATLTATLASALGVAPTTDPADFWAPVTTMGIALATLQAQAAARNYDPEAFAGFVLATGQEWDRANLTPLMEQLTACATSGQELEDMQGFALAWYESNGRAPLAPGLRWPADERAALEATLAEFCPSAAPPIPLPAELLSDPTAPAPTPEKSGVPTVAYVLGGVGLLAAVGGGIYYSTRKGKRR